MAAGTSLIPLDDGPRQVADDNSLLQIDHELDALLEQIDDEIEEHGEASNESMDLLQVFVEALNLKVDRIGRYLSVMETRAAFCRKEAARLVSEQSGRRARSSERNKWFSTTWRATIWRGLKAIRPHCAGRRTRRTA